MLQSPLPEATFPPRTAGAPLPSSCPDSEAAQLSTLSDSCAQATNSRPPRAVSTGYFCESSALFCSRRTLRTPGAGRDGQALLGADRLLV